MAGKPRRKLRLNLIRVRHAYSTGEIADLLNVTRGTVRIWQKKGLMAIGPGKRPFLFIGAEVKRFLLERQNARRVHLKENEFYCPRCRQARQSAAKNIEVKVTERRMGRTDVQVEIKGICAICGCRLTRFSTRNQVKRSFFGQYLTQGH